MGEATTRWREVEPVPALNGDLGSVLANVDVLRATWDQVLSSRQPGAHRTPRTARPGANPSKREPQ